MTKVNKLKDNQNLINGKSIKKIWILWLIIKLVKIMFKNVWANKTLKNVHKLNNFLIKIAILIFKTNFKVLLILKLIKLSVNSFLLLRQKESTKIIKIYQVNIKITISMKLTLKYLNKWIRIKYR